MGVGKVRPVITYCHPCDKHSHELCIVCTGQQCIKEVRCGHFRSWLSEDLVKLQAYNKLAIQCERRRERRVQSKFSSSSFSGFMSPLTAPFDSPPSGEFPLQSGPSGYKPHEEVS